MGRVTKTWRSTNVWTNFIFAFLFLIYSPFAPFFNPVKEALSCWVLTNHHVFFFPVSAPEFDVSEIETLFSAIVQKPVDKAGGRRKSVGAKPEKVQLVSLNILYTLLLPDIITCSFLVETLV